MSTPPVTAVLLAAGMSTRMGESNKLLVPIEGTPMVRRVADVLHSAGLPIIVVTGHEDAGVRNALADIPVVFIHNPEYASGMASSIRAGVAALPGDAAGVLLALADMPFVTVADVRAIVDAYRPGPRAIVVPVRAGRRGNPVLWGAGYFADLRALEGDTGGRQLFRRRAADIVEVEAPDDGVLRDIDTADALDGDGVSTRPDASGR